jgi:hypothetical protein
MNCQDFAGITRDYAREDTRDYAREDTRDYAREDTRDYAREEWISASAREEARRHLAVCESCRKRLEDDAALSAALAMAARESRTLEATPAVESAVLEAFRRARPSARRSFAAPLWWAAAAAVLLLAALLWPRRPQQPASPHVAVRDAPPAHLLQTEEAPSLKSESPLAPLAGRITPRSHPAPRRAENVTQFIPLRYGKPVESGETLQVVRITLRRADLLRLGLPVAPDGGAGLVKADVLLGEDGLTKAIRFVY